MKLKKHPIDETGIEPTKDRKCGSETCALTSTTALSVSSLPQVSKIIDFRHYLNISPRQSTLKSNKLQLKNQFFQVGIYILYQ